MTRRRTIVDALGCATLFAAMVTWFAYSSPGYVMPRTLLATTRTLLGPGSTMSSSDHLRDFVNELLLIGPVGAWVFATGLMLIMRRRERVDAVQGFLIVVGLTYLGACWLAGDSNLGYARNWDLLAPAGFVLTAAGVGLDGWKIPAGRPAPYLAILLVISAYQTIPWIAVNASEPRAIRRFASLPLGAGRAESTIGYWHALRGRDAEAEVWLKRAVAASPGNVRAHVFLGKLYFDQRRYGPALAEYRRAVALRPDLADLRLRAGEAARSDSLIRDGRVSP